MNNTLGNLNNILFEQVKRLNDDELKGEALKEEKEIGYSILKDTFLEELEPKFKQMKCKGIIPSEKMKSQKFWSEVKKALPEEGQISFLPCECSY